MDFQLLRIYLLLNLVVFALYGMDKRNAVKGNFRISEASLLILGLAGGGIGGLLGMQAFNHKTSKRHFYLMNAFGFIVFVYIFVSKIRM
ncbi:DUF1294 domain-containing protein [Peptoniphilus sp. KCTC 25270]|uniref:DUF1294 domain-containing protein n=1 Tax=Peptoniphilus sp. KCTC 25270 TaxID=2897414 RepID=UPI001E4DF004|nr:DUF1294 domain-containing protein [Peptoniphilus sp. KCTC 25270]MCD1147499.1 DUF1294 domain-containing protein [Peptoniphilus sp. KCTC 25270]